MGDAEHGGGSAVEVFFILTCQTPKTNNIYCDCALICTFGFVCLRVLRFCLCTQKVIKVSVDELLDRKMQTAVT